MREKLEKVRAELEGYRLWDGFGGFEGLGVERCGVWRCRFPVCVCECECWHFYMRSIGFTVSAWAIRLFSVVRVVEGVRLKVKGSRSMARNFDLRAEACRV